MSDETLTGNLFVEGKVSIGTASTNIRLEVNSGKPDGSPVMGVATQGADDWLALTCGNQINASSHIFWKQGTLSFGLTSNLEGQNFSEKLNISETGNVGIGIPEPAERLHIDGAVRGGSGQNGALRIRTDSGGYVDVGPRGQDRVEFHTDQSTYYFDKELRVDGGMIGSHVDDLNLCTAGSPRLTLRGDGKVGIGTINPQSDLDVRGRVNAYSLSFTDSTGTPYDENWIGMADNMGDGRKWLHFGGIVDTDKIRRSTYWADLHNFQGNVGIQTINPQSDLDVRGRVNAGSLSLTDPSGDPYPNNWIGMADNIGDGEKKWLHFGGITDTDNIRRSTYWADKHYFEGNIGISTSEINAKLDIYGGPYWTKNEWHKALKLSNASAIQFTASPNIYGIGASHSGDSLYFFRTSTEGHTEDKAHYLMVLNSGKFQVNVPAFKPGGGTWAHTSDIRLKKNVSEISGSLDKLLQLRGIHFEWKDPANNGNLAGRQIGMAAQEVEKVFPDWVGEDSDGYKYLAIKGFEALTVEGFRELKSEIQAKNAVLEARISALENKLVEH